MRPTSHCLLGLVGILVGCSSAGTDEPVSGQRHPDLEERLLHHGFREPGEVERLVGELRAAAQHNDRRALVRAIHYPLTTYQSGTPVRRYEHPDDVRDDYDALFSERVLNALRAAQYDRLFVRDQGAMIGGGEVWLFQYEEGVRIKAINP